MSWLRTEDSVINMDFIESFKILRNVYDHDFKVVLFPAGDGDTYCVCEGSEKMCREYMKQLNDHLEAKLIQVYETHPCRCYCGCRNEVIEGYSICEDCENGFHIDKDGFRKKLELKKDAA